MKLAVYRMRVQPYGDVLIANLVGMLTPRARHFVSIFDKMVWNNPYRSNIGGYLSNNSNKTTQTNDVISVDLVLSTVGVVMTSWWVCSACEALISVQVFCASSLARWVWSYVSAMRFWSTPERSGDLLQLYSPRCTTRFRFALPQVVLLPHMRFFSIHWRSSI